MSIFGKAQPYLDKAPEGGQIWYRYIIPPCSNEKSKIVGIRVTDGSEKEIHVKLNDACFFYLNYKGEIVDRFFGDDCRGETELHLIPNEKNW